MTLTVLKSKQRGGGWHDALPSPGLLEGCGCKLERGQEAIQGHGGGGQGGVEEGQGGLKERGSMRVLEGRGSQEMWRGRHRWCVFGAKGGGGGRR